MSKNFNANKNLVIDFAVLIDLLQGKYGQLRSGNAEAVTDYRNLQTYAQDLSSAINLRQPARYFSTLFDMAMLSIRMADKGIKGNDILRKAIEVMFSNSWSIKGKKDLLAKLIRKVK